MLSCLWLNRGLKEDLHDSATKEHEELNNQRLPFTHNKIASMETVLQTTHSCFPVCPVSKSYNPYDPIVAIETCQI